MLGSQRVHPFILFILPFATRVQCQQLCYFPNGTALPVTDPWYGQFRSCGIDPVRTICCALNRPLAPGGNATLAPVQDSCLPNGLCENTIEQADSGVATSWWLDFCTDSTYAEGKCLDVCRKTRNEWGGSPMTPCDGTRSSTKWCCGTSKSCCTNNGGDVELPLSFNVRTQSSTSSASTSPTSSTSSLSTAATPTTPTNKTDTSRNNSLSSGAEAGIGVGVALGVVALVALAFFIRRALLWRKKAKLSPALLDAPSAAPPYSEGEMGYKYQLSDNPRMELSNQNHAGELPGTEYHGRPTELPGVEVSRV